MARYMTVRGKIQSHTPQTSLEHGSESDKYIWIFKYFGHKIYPITLPSSTPGTLALFFNQVPIHEKRRFSNLPWPTLLLTLSGRPAALSPEQERFPILSRSSSPWSCPWCGPRLLCFPPCHESPFHVKFLYTNIHHTSTLLLLFLLFFGLLVDHNLYYSSLQNWISITSIIIVIKFHHISSAKPSVLQNFSSCLRILVITQHHLRTYSLGYIHQHHLSTMLTQHALCDFKDHI